MKQIPTNVKYVPTEGWQKLISNGKNTKKKKSCQITFYILLNNQRNQTAISINTEESRFAGQGRRGQ